jgi:hypothetical protein
VVGRQRHVEHVSYCLAGGAPRLIWLADEKLFQQKDRSGYLRQRRVTEAEYQSLPWRAPNVGSG